MKVGVIGCGQISKMHIPEIQRYPGAVLVGIADSNREMLEKTAAQFNITAPRYTDPLALLREQRPEVVHILTPPQSHFEMAKAALESGAHVFVEKPMTVNAEEAEALAEVARASGKQVCVGLSHLFDAVMLEARRIVESGTIGAVYGIESFYGFDQDPKYFLKGLSHWSYDLPGGIIQNRIDHPLSVLLPFLKEPVSLSSMAVSAPSVIPAHTPAEIRMQLSDGACLAHATVSLAAGPRQHFLALYGTKGTLRVDFLNKRISLAAHLPGVPKPISRALMNLREGWAMLGNTFGNVIRVIRKDFHPYEGLPQLIRTFYQALETGQPSPVPVEDGLRVMRMMDTVWRQADTPGLKSRVLAELNRPVEVDGRRPAVLVTGGTGFLGARLVRRLCRDGQGPVRILVRDVRKLERLKGLPVEVVLGDLSDAVKLREAMQGIRIVYHLAAAMGGKWEDYQEQTIQGTQRVVDAALEAGVERFVYVSSIAVYGIPTRRQAITEDLAGATNHVTEYGKSKLEAERVVQEAVKTRGLRATILRPGVVYGPGCKLGLSRIGYKVGRWFVIIGCNDIELPAVYVDNVVEAMVLAGSSSNGIGHAYNVIDDARFTQTGYITRLGRANGTRYRYIFFPYTLASACGAVARAIGTRVGLVAKIASVMSPFHLKSCATRLVYDNSRIKAELGWRPAADLDAQFRSLVN